MSRDTTSCYRHCQGILYFPSFHFHLAPWHMLLPSDHSAPSIPPLDPWPWHHLGLILLNPHHTHCLMDSLVPPLSSSHSHLTSLWRMIQNQTWTSSFPWHHTIQPLPLTLTPCTVNCYWLTILTWWTFPLSLTYVTITPYLSRDTTYCYRHCKGISCFPLLPYHPLPWPMPDRITSASWPSFASYHLIGLMPRTPSCILPHRQPHSLLSLSLPPWRHHDIWLRPRLRPYPFLWHHPSMTWPLPLTLTIRTVDCYWLIPITWWTFPLSLTYCTMLWLILAYAAYWYSPTLWRRRWLILTYHDSSLRSFY